MAHDSPDPTLPARITAPHPAPAPAQSPTSAPLPAHPVQKRYRTRHDGWSAARWGFGAAWVLYVRARVMGFHAKALGRTPQS